MAVGLTIEQQKAIALAKAKQKMAEGEEAEATSPLESEVNKGFLSNIKASPETLLSVPRGILNAGKSAVGLGLAGADMVGEMATGEDWDMSENFNKNYPLYQAPKDDLVAQLGVGLGEVAPGVLAGGMGGAALGGKIAGQAGKWLGGFIGGSGGEAVTADKSDGPLIVNDNPEEDGWIDGFKSDPNGDYEDELFKKTANFAEDALLTSILAGTAGKAVGKAGEVVGPIVSDAFNFVRRTVGGWNELDAHKQKFVKALLDRSSQAFQPNMTEDQIAQVYEEVVDFVGQNSKLISEFGDASIDDITTNLDTVTTLLKKLNPEDPADAVIIHQLESLRSAAMSGGSSRLQAAIEAPRNDLNKTLDNIQMTRGGTKPEDFPSPVDGKSIDGKPVDNTASKDIAVQEGSKRAAQQTQDTLVKYADDTSRQSDEIIGKAQDDILTEERSMDSLLESDPEFGPKIQESKSGGIKLNVNDESLDKQTQAVMKARDIRKMDKGTRDEAYEAIPDKTPADMDSFIDVNEKALEYMSPELKTLVGNSDGTYKYLNNTVMPKLQKELNAAYGETIPNKNKIDALQALKKNIKEDQVGYLTEHGNEVSINAAKNANKQNIEYSKSWNDGLGEDLKINEAKTRMKPNKFIEEGRSKVLSAIKDPNRRESVKQLYDILGKSGDENLVADIALAEAVKDISTDGFDLNKITKSLQGMSSSFTGKQAKRIEDFLTKAKAKGANIETLKADFQKLSANLEDSKKMMYEGYLKDFFEKNPIGGYEPRSNPVKNIENIFTNPHSKDKLDQIIAVAGKDPAAMKGLQAVWARKAREVLDSQKSTPEIQQILRDYGKQVFPDNPEAIDAIYALNQQSYRVDKAKTARQGAGFDFKEEGKKEQMGINSVLTWMFGVLNPTRARANTIVKDLASKNDLGGVAKTAGDMILANADEFSQIARQIIQKEKGKMSPESKRRLFRMMTQAGLYSGSETDQQTQSAFDFMGNKSSEKPKEEGPEESSAIWDFFTKKKPAGEYQKSIGNGTPYFTHDDPAYKDAQKKSDESIKKTLSK